MIEIQFSRLVRHGDALDWEIVAMLRVDGPHLEVGGDQDFLEARDIELLDIETGASVTFDSDPEAWARNLPQAFRSGDLRCEVVHDSSSAAARDAAIAAGA